MLPIDDKLLVVILLGVDSVSPSFSTLVLSKLRPFSLGFRRFSRKKDPGKNGEGARCACVSLQVEFPYTHKRLFTFCRGVS